MSRIPFHFQFVISIVPRRKIEFKNAGLHAGSTFRYSVFQYSTQQFLWILFNFRCSFLFCRLLAAFFHARIHNNWIEVFFFHFFLFSPSLIGFALVKFIHAFSPDRNEICLIYEMDFNGSFSPFYEINWMVFGVCGAFILYLRFKLLKYSNIFGLFWFSVSLSPHFNFLDCFVCFFLWSRKPWSL